MSRKCSLHALWLIGGFLVVATPIQSTAAEALREDAENVWRAQQLAETGAKFDLEGESKYARFTWLAALRLDPDCPLARSRLGYIRQGDQWISATDDSFELKATRTSADYRRAREGRLDRAGRELSLGIWCQAHSLLDLAVVHLQRVATSREADSATQLAAARRLDLQPFGGRLMTRQEIAEMQHTMQTALRDLNDWSQQLTKWVRQLQGSRATQRVEAIEALRQIDNPAAIPAIELLMSTRDEPLASEAVGIISNIQHADAAESLVRHAVASPWPRVRWEATVQLEKRPLHEFVPLLLGSLQAPIRSVFQVTPGPAGQILHEHLLFQEGAEENLQLELTSLAVAALAPSRDRPWNARGQQRNVFNQAQRIEQGVATRNAFADQQNRQIYQVLEKTTRQQLDLTPTAWWDWWREYNEYESPKSKPTRRWQNYVAYQYLPTPTGCECFPAGTLVWTESGQRSIEQIEVGDRVLSQDPTTGQLSYKPVAGVTRRAEAKMQQMQVGDTTLKLTTGHPVWVNGRGWRMAKLLRLGDQIHTMHGAQTVNGLAVESPDTAYNLIVADFATFFVTEQGILVHDNNARTPIDVDTPGLQLASSSIQD